MHKSLDFKAIIKKAFEAMSPNPPIPEKAPPYLGRTHTAEGRLSPLVTTANILQNCTIPILVIVKFVENKKIRLSKPD